MAEEKKLNYSSFCHNLAEEQTILAVGNKRMANMTIIEKMCRIAEKMQPEEGNSRNMSFSNMEKASEEINALAEELGLNDIQTVILTTIVRRSSRDELDGNDIAFHLGLSYLKFLAYYKEVIGLKDRGYIHVSVKGKIKLPRTVLTCLLENRPVAPEQRTGLTANQLLMRIKKELDSREDDFCTTSEAIEELNELMTLNPDNSVSRTIMKIFGHLTDQTEAIIVYGLVYLYYFDDDDMVSWRNLDDYMSETELMDFKMDYKFERLSLQKNKVIEYAGRNSVMSKDYFKLSDEVKEELFADVGGIRKEEKNVAASKKMLSADILPKTLFYNPEEHRQVEQLKKLMSQERLNDIRARMEDKGLRTGFTCLFYGGPGTGKTETVYQIARESGRDLFIVDVSQIKSCWVGESEKSIKKVFDKYREAVKDGGIIPILLFNEADAVFGIRQEGAESAVDKMENSIQNIILQEMEDLDGILIATTNLTTNLDKAFERRFLYKIRFERPSREARVSIWRAMMPSLSEEEAKILANNYDFSGGQIENIVRKREIQSIIDSTEPGFNDVLSFCSEEVIGNGTGRRRIGF